MSSSCHNRRSGTTQTTTTSGLAALRVPRRVHKEARGEKKTPPIEGCRPPPRSTVTRSLEAQVHTQMVAARLRPQHRSFCVNWKSSANVTADFRAFLGSNIARHTRPPSSLPGQQTARFVSGRRRQSRTCANRAAGSARRRSRRMGARSLRLLVHRVCS